MVKTTGKKTSPGSIRSLNLPEAIGVEEDEQQRPVAVTLRRRRLTTRSTEDRWEIVDEWWRGSPVARRYYRVILEDGAGLTIFHDLVSGLWYRQQA